MKKKLFVLNFVASFGCQIVNLLCGFILPRLILSAYGTEINGLVSSINQFLTIVSLTEFGMTAVVQSSLYGALATKNMSKISEIMTSSSRFFSKIGQMLIIYVILLGTLYPILIETNFDYFYVLSLVIILSVNSIAQYLLGITNDQLISADQHAYVTSLTALLTTILNTIACYFVIRMGAGIHTVKATTALIFLIRPVVSSIYVKTHYHINRHAEYSVEPIKQKWNGVAQHIAYYIFSSTDVIVLTIFSTLENVSVYSVYALILNGLKQLCSLFENGIKPLLGEAWAQKDKQRVKKYFSIYEVIMHLESISVFGVASVLIIPFVTIYTRAVTDCNYIVPAFSFWITVAYMALNIRNPYNAMIQAIGCYRQTQFSYIITAIINIVLSIAMVYKFGLIGVAIGTLGAALYQDCWQANYIYKTFLNYPFNRLFKLFLCDVTCYIVGKILSSLVHINVSTYFGWAIMAIPVALIWLAVVVIVGGIFFGEEFRGMLTIVREKEQ